MTAIDHVRQVASDLQRTIASYIAETFTAYRICFPSVCLLKFFDQVMHLRRNHGHFHGRLGDVEAAQLQQRCAGHRRQAGEEPGVIAGIDFIYLTDSRMFCEQTK